MLEIIKETASMYTRDGVRLDADIYRPQGDGEFPILLMRQPYGRAIASTVVYAHPSWYAYHGYIVVIQDVRGRGTSEGEFELFAHEIEDGLDTVNWVSKLAGSTGEVGMYGFSYQGMTQLYAAAYRPGALKVICPAMVAYDLYSDWAYENDAFCLQANLGWAIQLAAETARLRGEEQAFQKLYLASRNLPLSDSIPANPNILRELAPDSFYHAWLNNAQPGEYWEKLSPKNFLEEIDLPMLHIGGWFDPYLRGTINLYKAMRDCNKSFQHLIVGAWAHLPWGRKLGEKDYGQQAASPIDLIQIKWFNKFLKNIDSQVFKKPPVCLFEMGTNRWKYFDKFPDRQQQYLYLQSNGLAGMREDAGKLISKIKKKRSTKAKDVLVHDPWRPIPALGGHASIPSGSFDRASLDCRSDVLTYTSSPLKRNLRIVGEVILEVYCEADAPSFDLCAVLSEVDRDGKVYNFTQGYIRIDSKKVPIKIPLQATCIKIARGNCLRLSLSAACFPAYPVNNGDGKLPADAKLIDAKIITLTISSGSDSLSHLKFYSYY
ncbi:MAG: CocE/NonD family hydrolase [Xenococcaceae cyanobacterium]